jgi:hypothetical protein
MERITMFKSPKRLACTFAAIFFAQVAQSAAPGAPGQSTRLPIMYYAGVIPVQWDKDEVWQDLGQVKATINSEFSNAVKASKRFSMINDELTKSLWKTLAGRKELVADYELSAFANLDVSARGDMVVLTTRLLSPTLETRLQESEVIPRKWLSESDRAQTSARLVDLVQRMINRLPVDAHVTSVSGVYATVSAGTDQNVRIGSKFEVLAASIEKIHPANGSWLSFTTMKTGTIEVVEVKPQSSIAKITSLTFENAVKPGDGIRIGDISGRNRFARAEESSTMDPAHQNQSAAEATMAPPPAPKKTPLSPPLAVAPPSSTEPAAAPPAAADAPPSDPAAPEAVAAPSEAPPTDSFTAKLMPKGSDLRAWLGLKMWSISGSASATATLPAWIVNSGGADIFRNFSDTIDFNYGLDLGYGKTGKGSFFGYDLHSGGRWHMHLKDILPGADDVYFGLLASLASTSIKGETSGGYDLTLVRLTIGIHGWAKPEFIGDKIEWTGEFFYPLYYSGQFGVKGSHRSIESGSSVAFRVGGYLGDRPATGWQFGTAFDYESSDWTLAKKKTASYGSIGLLALARRNL